MPRLILTDSRSVANFEVDGRTISPAEPILPDRRRDRAFKRDPSLQSLVDPEGVAMHSRGMASALSLCCGLLSMQWEMKHGSARTDFLAL